MARGFELPLSPLMGRVGGPARRRRRHEPAASETELVAQAPAVPLREEFRRFWPYVRTHWRWLAVALVLLTVQPLIEGTGIWLFKRVVDDVLVPGDFSAFVPLALGFVGLAVAGGIASIGSDMASTLVSQRFLLSLRTEFFSHLHRLSVDFFERRRLGDIVARLTGDTAAIESFLVSGLLDALTYGVRVILFAGALFYLRWELALVALAMAPLFGLPARRFARSIKSASREKRRRSGTMTALAEESLGNAALVQAYNRQGWEVERFHQEGVAKFRAEMASTRLKALFTPLVDGVELVSSLVVMGVGAVQLGRGRLSLGGLFVFLTFLDRLYSPIRRLSRLSTSMYSASAAAERIIEFLDEPAGVPAHQTPLVLDRAVGRVECDGITFRYPGAPHDALRDVSLRVAPGETLALVGPSGAGKSTLAKLLLRLYDPGSGEVRLDGHDVRSLELASLRDNLAVVLQETLVFDGTVRDNIAYGRQGATREEIEDAAYAADAHTFIQALPDSYDTVVGQRGRRLSGGQRQRLAIARAMVRNAPVLILDEPSTGLDAESSQRIVGPLRQLMAGRTTILISHSLLMVRDADHIVVLDQGSVVEEGRHDGLLGQDGLYASLWRAYHPGSGPVDDVDLDAGMPMTSGPAVR